MSKRGEVDVKDERLQKSLVDRSVEMRRRPGGRWQHLKQVFECHLFDNILEREEG